MITKKLSFVVDIKGNDIMAPQFVPSHSSVLRQYQVLAERSDDDQPMFVRFPEDYVLITVDFSSDGVVCQVGDISSTRFIDFIGGFPKMVKASEKIVNKKPSSRVSKSQKAGKE